MRLLSTVECHSHRAGALNRAGVVGAEAPQSQNIGSEERKDWSPQLQCTPSRGDPAWPPVYTAFPRLHQNIAGGGLYPNL